MRTKTFDMTVFDEAGNDFNVTVTAKFNPSERQTRDYPGCPAHIESVEVVFEDGIDRPEIVKENEDLIEEEAMELFLEREV